MVDQEVRRILLEGHEQALHIIETHREQHKLIAEALLKYETLDEKQILSLYKTGKMPEEDVVAAEDEQHAQTFEESKRELERRENAKAEATEEDAEQTTSQTEGDEQSTPQATDAEQDKQADQTDQTKKPTDPDQPDDWDHRE